MKWAERHGDSQREERRLGLDALAAWHIFQGPRADGIAYQSQRQNSPIVRKRSRSPEIGPRRCCDVETWAERVRFAIADPASLWPACGQPTLLLAGQR